MSERAATLRRSPRRLRRPQRDWKSLWFAIGMHLLLVLALVLELNWKNEKPGPMQVELIMAGNNGAPPPPPKIEPAPEIKPDPKPEPVPEVTPPPPPTPPVPPREVAPAQVDPDIALQEERKRKLEQERVAHELAEKKAKEEAHKEDQRLKHERELAEKKEREKIEQERKDKERKELEKKAKEDAEKKALEEKKQKEEADKKKLKEEADKKQKEEADKKAKAEAAKKAAADKALRDAFRNDALGTPGSPNGTADKNQTGGANSNGYQAAIIACVKPGVTYPTPPRTSGTNPTAIFRVQVKSDNTVSSIKLVNSSGISRFDEAVEIGIRKCSPLPKRPAGLILQYFDLEYQMYD